LYAIKLMYYLPNNVLIFAIREYIMVLIILIHARIRVSFSCDKNSYNESFLGVVA